MCCLSFFFLIFFNVSQLHTTPQYQYISITNSRWCKDGFTIKRNTDTSAAAHQLNIVISINYYFAGMYQRTGGGCQVRGELWDRSL